MIIVFDKLLLNCIHDLSLHNRIRENYLRSFFAWLVRAFSEYNDKTLTEVKQTKNCHPLNYGTQLKVIDFFNKYARKREVKLFVSYANLYQISIPNTEIRLIGDLKLNYFHTKEKAYNDLFSVLFIDFDHSLHKNLWKLKAKEKQKLICIMSPKDCLDY
ncbi:MAG: hypothetical protein I3274_02650 [Candidatus Moeniiplasma glomeromycotorum]|nr:hypothetical protein [Candidatus Moeniiplasma glomeromycotorum]MCE8167504.1 hypothetical protein [Candidatus Moeniiplasma glomeromycotorum]